MGDSTHSDFERIFRGWAHRMQSLQNENESLKMAKLDLEKKLKNLKEVLDKKDKEQIDEWAQQKALEFLENKDDVRDIFSQHLRAAVETLWTDREAKSGQHFSDLRAKLAVYEQDWSKACEEIRVRYENEWKNTNDALSDLRDIQKLYKEAAYKEAAVPPPKEQVAKTPAVEKRSLAPPQQAKAKVVEPTDSSVETVIGVQLKNVESLLWTVDAKLGEATSTCI